MITINFVAMKEGSEEYDVAASLTINDDLTYKIAGPQPDYIDLDFQPIAPTFPAGRVSFAEDPVAWARNLRNSCRTPYIYIETVVDTFPNDSRESQSTS